MVEEAEKDQWATYEMRTSQCAMELCEKLRIILEPSLASQMKGDYRTGKKINMKKADFLVDLVSDFDGVCFVSGLTSGFVGVG